jgi:cysteine synthase
MLRPEVLVWRTNMNIPWYDLNATRALPRFIEVDPRVLPKWGAEICLKNRLRPHAVICYENEAETIKLWPASGIIASEIEKMERGENLDAVAFAESTSGGFGVGAAIGLKEIRALKPDFSIRRVIAVVPRTLQPGKIARLLKYECIELKYAKDAADAMRLVEELSQKHKYLYMRQYWNRYNSASYARIAAEVAHRLPNLGIWVCGVGSGGTIDGTVPVLQEAFKDRVRPERLFCSAVAVEQGQSVGGVRTEIGLQLNGRPGGLPWRSRAHDVNYVGLKESLDFSWALSQQHSNDSTRRIIGGESTGFALVGGLLSALKLQVMGKLDSLRDEAGDIFMAFPAPDTFEPYREDYEAHGISLPD